MKVSLITVSTSRYEKLSKGIRFSDESGTIAFDLVKSAGFNVTSPKTVDDSTPMIRQGLLKCIYDDGSDAVILIGGTGLAKRDITIESVSPLLDKELNGFAEIFRAVSFKEIGTSAYLSRCIAGCLDGRMVYCLPGSPQAVKTALELILPELPHALYIARS